MLILLSPAPAASFAFAVGTRKIQLCDAYMVTCMHLFRLTHSLLLFLGHSGYNKPYYDTCGVCHAIYAYLGFDTGFQKKK